MLTDGTVSPLKDHTGILNEVQTKKDNQSREVIQDFFTVSKLQSGKRSEVIAREKQCRNIKIHR